MNAPGIIFESPPCVNFAVEPARINSPARRLEAWAEVCKWGATNYLRVDGIGYSWSTLPRLQKNGAALGRVHEWRPGQPPRDIGGYKIDGHGHVLELPAPLRAVLPGAEGAQASAPEEAGP